MERKSMSKMQKSKEPVFIVKPVMKNYGLDYLHITLLVLVVILIAVAFALSTFKQSIVITGCSNSSINSTCNTTTATHTSAQALAAAERYLAAYTYVNTTLSLVPYYSLVNQSNVSYLAGSKEWIVVVPYIDTLANNQRYDLSLLLYDSNLSLASSFIQTIKPAASTNNSVVAFGTVNIYNEAECNTTTPIPVYVITDPYAPGALGSLQTVINASKPFSNSISLRYYFIFSGYTSQYYSSFGVNQTQLLGQYMLCASGQPARFNDFISNLSIAFYGRPLENQTLYDVVLGSGLNRTDFATCMQNSTKVLNIQAKFAKLYNVVSTPEVIVNCRYATLPETMRYAINYSIRNLKG